MSFGFKPALISKGLRPRPAVNPAVPLGFKPALISKGLRLDLHLRIQQIVLLQASPDFKGIKTAVSFGQLVALGRFKPALISKGLRL